MCSLVLLVLDLAVKPDIHHLHSVGLAAAVAEVVLCIGLMLSVHLE